MNYTTLIAAKTVDGSIKQWLNWDLVPSTTILSEAEAEIYSRLRVREMREMLSSSIDADAETLDMPDDYIAPIHLRIIGQYAGRIKFLDEEYFERLRCEDGDGNIISGVPACCIELGDNPVVLHFDMKVQAQMLYRLMYWKRPLALSTDNLENFLTRRYPQLLRTACLYCAFRFKKDWATAEKELQLMERAINAANIEFDMAQQAYRTDMYTDY